MPELLFDLDATDLKDTEFGVGVNPSGSGQYEDIRISKSTREHLLSTAQETYEGLSMQDVESRAFDPSNLLASTESLYLTLNDPMAKVFAQLHQLENIPTNNSRMSQLGSVHCYYARFLDSTGRRLTAMRRAAQFKSLRKGVLGMLRDQLTLMEGPIVTLNSTFDVLIDSENIHILHPIGFVQLGNIEDFILEATDSSLGAVKGSFQSFDLSGVEELVRRSPRAAKMLSSIIEKEWHLNTEVAALLELCSLTDVSIESTNGGFAISAGDEEGFLEALDRRRFVNDLSKEGPEGFRAPSRYPIKQ